MAKNGYRIAITEHESFNVNRNSISNSIQTGDNLFAKGYVAGIEELILALPDSIKFTYKKEFTKAVKEAMEYVEFV